MTKEKKERKIGRYWATDLWKILNNKIKPEDFLKEEEYNLDACKNMFEGEVREMALKTLFDAGGIKYEYQVKKEKDFGGFVIVAVADFVFPRYVLECKCPKEFTGMKEYHLPQLEAQYRLFEKDVYVGYFKERMASVFYRYRPNEKFWQEILEKVKEFDKKLKLCHQNM